MAIETVVLPAAGLGTRMLPATRSVPKELLPVYDMPLLQFALNEAVQSGASRIVLVSHPSKVALDDYMQRPADLEKTLREKRKLEALSNLARATLPAGVETTIVHQDEPLGLGHAVLQAKDHVAGDAFAVILPDDLLLDGTCLRDMAQAYDDGSLTSLVAAVEVPADRVGSYGIFDVGPSIGRTIPARGLVEKPTSEHAPSRLAAIGRYVLASSIFEILEASRPGAGGEIQLTDAIDALGGLYAWRVEEPRFDCGSKEGLFEAAMAVREARLKETSAVKIAAE